MYMLSYKAECLTQQGKVTGILYIYLCVCSYMFMAKLCRGLHDRETAMKY